MPDSRTKALLISVGGSSGPIINSINELKPECLCFFASEEGRSIINSDILPALKERPAWMADIVTTDPYDLLSCYRSLTGKWQELRQNWRLEPGDWTVDYTEGTKPMVAALMLVTLNDSSGYRYTGGTKALSQINPWDEIAGVHRHEATILFGRAQYGQSAEIFRRLVQRVSGGEKHIYRALTEIVEGYRLWDNFQYKAAWEKLKPSCKSLEMAIVFGGPPGIKTFTTKIRESLSLLEKLSVGTPGIKREHFFDLLANARRRADLEHKYDDAMSRLYRAIEVYAQIGLASRGIDISDVQADQLPQEIRQEFAGKYRDDIDNRIKLPLYGAYRILQLLKDPAGSIFFEHWPQMKLLLDSRNKSILVHGLESVKRERFEEMFKLVCKISSVAEESIPRFPEIIL